MRDQSQSIAPTPAAPPAIDPSRWEDFPAFRETFLLHYTAPGYNAALRGLGTMLFELALEAGHGPLFPALPGPSVRHELAAAAGDLRHLQGFLATVAAEQEGADPDDPDDADLRRLSKVAARLAPQVERIAAAVEEAVRQ